MAITEHKDRICVYCGQREESVTVVFREPNGSTTDVPLCHDCGRHVWDYIHWRVGKSDE